MEKPWHERTVELLARLGVYSPYTFRDRTEEELLGFLRQQQSALENELATIKALIREMKEK